MHKVTQLIVVPANPLESTLLRLLEAPHTVIDVDGSDTFFGYTVCEQNPALFGRRSPEPRSNERVKKGDSPILPRPDPVFGNLL